MRFTSLVDSAYPVGSVYPVGSHYLVGFAYPVSSVYPVGSAYSVGSLYSVGSAYDVENIFLIALFPGFHKCIRSKKIVSNQIVYNSIIKTCKFY